MAHKIDKLENVAIAMHCNLRPPDATPVLIGYDALKRLEVAQPIRCRLSRHAN